MVKKTREVGSGNVVHPVREGHATSMTLIYNPILEGSSEYNVMEGGVTGLGAIVVPFCGLYSGSY